MIATELPSWRPPQKSGVVMRHRLLPVVDMLLSLWRWIETLLGRGGSQLQAVEGSMSASGALVAEHRRPVDSIPETTVAVLKREEVIISVRVGDDHSQSLAVDVTPDGEIALLVLGKPSRGEDSVSRVATLLIERLRQDGGEWNVPRNTSAASGREEVGVDAISFGAGGQILQIQTVRANSAPGMWRSLSVTGRAVDRHTAKSMADTLRATIEMKAAGITSSQRAQLTLALDATVAANLAFDGSVIAFRKLHGAWACQLGFASIWVVGPSVSLTRRLDVDDAT